MRILCSLIRYNITATSVVIDVLPIDPIRRWIASSIRMSGQDSSKYHFIGYGDISDISATDRLEEITGTVTGSVYKIINKRESTGSHLEFDLDLYGKD